MIRISLQTTVAEAVRIARRLGCDLVLRGGAAYLRPRQRQGR
ncbi:hypothetical protein [Halorhodospira neutriphila]|nr:hypothetical protein [Halorhodospira neutriphila]